MGSPKQEYKNYETVRKPTINSNIFESIPHENGSAGCLRLSITKTDKFWQSLHKRLSRGLLGCMGYSMLEAAPNEHKNDL